MAESQSGVGSVAQEFFEQSYAAFAKATQTVSQTIDYSYHLVDRTFRLRFAGDSLIPYITPALAHLRRYAGADPDLTISLWDARSTGVTIPPLPAMLQTYSQQQNLRFQVDDYGMVFQPAYGMMSLLDKRKNHGIFWIEDAQAFPWYESAAPFMNLFHWWLSDSCWQIVHTAAVGTAQGGLLLVGKSGSGKSTTALRAFQGGMNYVGDDYCLVNRDAAPTVASLYSSGKLLFTDEDAFPCLRTARSSNTYVRAAKAVYFFQERFSDQLVGQMPIRAILIPTITGETNTWLTPVSPAAALQAVAPSTVFQLPGRQAAGIQVLSQVVRQVPAYRLALGTETDEIPHILSQLLERG